MAKLGRFRSEFSADQGLTSLAHMDSTLFAQCFNGQSKENQSWCSHCHSLDHASDVCPLKPRPPKSLKLSGYKPEPPHSKSAEICHNFNSQRGCKFGKKMPPATHLRWVWGVALSDTLPIGVVHGSGCWHVTSVKLGLSNPSELYTTLAGVPAYRC